MQPNNPQITVPRVADDWAQAEDPFDWAWKAGTTLPPFQRADGSGPATWATTTRLCFNRQALFVRFDCTDPDIWGTYTKRDEPIYDEEVVELFIAPAATAAERRPSRYYELEISPNGVLLDVLIQNPTGNRADLQADFSWDCPGLRWGARRDDAAQQWSAYLALPWAALTTAEALPHHWHANFYRIERPRNGTPEFSCWSPTMTEPADFHKPAYFGMLTLAT